MKYQYSPGLFGYGAKGSDGSTGLQGMSLYFTDYDVIFNKSNIEYAIQNNFVLLAGANPNTTLPNGKTYVTGDLFVVPNGDIYIINAETDTYAIAPGKFSKADIFTYITTMPDGFQRWENSTGYLIDNVNSNTTSDYTLNKSIYGISYKEFTRIELCDIPRNNVIPFSLYSTGENAFIDDHQSIALVYDNQGSFRLGNIDDTTSLIRNVNIILDASSVQYNRSHPFNNSTAIGNVLTNNEMNKPLLYSPTFVSSPASFYCASSFVNNVTIRWKLNDFVPTLIYISVNGDYHYGDTVPGLVVGTDYTLISGTIDIYEEPGTSTLVENWFSGKVFTWLGVQTNAFHFVFNNAVLQSIPVISGDLYFYKDVSSSRIYNLLDSSTVGVMPMIFHNVPPDGSVNIYGFSYYTVNIGQWNAHMVIKQNGWERQSSVIHVHPYNA